MDANSIKTQRDSLQYVNLREIKGIDENELKRNLSKIQNQFEDYNNLKDLLFVLPSANIDSSSYTISKISIENNENELIFLQFHKLFNNIKAMPSMKIMENVERFNQDRSQRILIYEGIYIPIIFQDDFLINNSIKDILNIDCLKKDFIIEVAQLISEICSNNNEFILEIKDLLYDPVNHKIALVCHQNLLNLNAFKIEKRSNLQQFYMADLFLSSVIISIGGIPLLTSLYPFIKHPKDIVESVFSELEKILKNQAFQYLKLIIKEALNLVKPFISDTIIFSSLQNLILDSEIHKNNFQEPFNLENSLVNEPEKFNFEQLLIPLYSSFSNIRQILEKYSKYDNPSFQLTVRKSFESLVNDFTKIFLKRMPTKQITKNQLNLVNQIENNVSSSFIYENMKYSTNFLDNDEENQKLKKYLGGKNLFASILYDKLAKIERQKEKEIAKKNCNERINNIDFTNIKIDHDDENYISQNNQKFNNSNVFSSNQICQSNSKVKHHKNKEKNYESNNGIINLDKGIWPEDKKHEQKQMGQNLYFESSTGSIQEAKKNKGVNKNLKLIQHGRHANLKRKNLIPFYILPSDYKRRKINSNQKEIMEENFSDSLQFSEKDDKIIKNEASQKYLSLLNETNQSNNDNNKSRLDFGSKRNNYHNWNEENSQVNHINKNNADSQNNNKSIKYKINNYCSNEVEENENLKETSNKDKLESILNIIKSEDSEQKLKLDKIYLICLNKDSKPEKELNKKSIFQSQKLQKEYNVLKNEYNQVLIANNNLKLKNRSYLEKIELSENVPFIKKKEFIEKLRALKVHFYKEIQKKKVNNKIQNKNKISLIEQTSNFEETKFRKSQNESTKNRYIDSDFTENSININHNYCVPDKSNTQYLNKGTNKFFTVPIEKGKKIQVETQKIQSICN